MNYKLQLVPGGENALPAGATRFAIQPQNAPSFLMLHETLKLGKNSGVYPCVGTGHFFCLLRGMVALTFVPLSVVLEKGSECLSDFLNKKGPAAKSINNSISFLLNAGYAVFVPAGFYPILLGVSHENNCMERPAGPAKDGAVSREYVAAMVFPVLQAEADRRKLSSSSERAFVAANVGKAMSLYGGVKCAGHGALSAYRRLLEEGVSASNADAAALPASDNAH